MTKDIEFLSKKWKFYVIEDPKWYGFSIDKDGKVTEYFGPDWENVQSEDNREES